MRSSRPLLAAATAAIIAASTVAVAGAFISSASSSVIKLGSAPPSVALNALENSTKVFAFDEKQRVTLTSAVTIDGAAPGVYTQFPLGTATIPAGSLVDSHFVHSDVPTGAYTKHRTGSVTFGADIIGVVASTARLAASDSQLGATGTTYAGNTRWRGLENGENGSSGSDKFTISADHRTVSIDFNTLAIDNIRVITQHSDQLSTAVTDSPDPVQAGNDITYLVTVTNNGGYAVPNVFVTDAFPNTTLVSAASSGGCTGTTSVTCGLGSINPGASGVATVVVTSPSTVPSGGTVVNTASAPPGINPTSATTTVVAPLLTTTIADSPDPVTAGNDVQYTITVKNDGIAPVADAHVVDTLPPGTSLVTTSAPGGCSGSGPVDCALGALGVGDSAQAQLVVTSPSTVPVGGTITDSGVASPGANVAASEVTTVETSEPGVSKGFVLPGDSITIPGDDPATVTLPEGGPGAPIIITQGDGTFCDGPCAGPATEISPFPGYDDPNNPIHLTLTYNFPSSPNSLTDAASAFGSTIFKNDDPLHPNLGTVVPFCSTVGGGVAIPHPCIDAHTITQPSFNSFVVTFEILYISGDPRFARH
jgi:conserved repeat domain